jgi:hypothetical protein
MNLVVMPNFKENPNQPDDLSVANSKLLWHAWCQKNGHAFIAIDSPIAKFSEIVPQMQKMWVQDIIDNSGIEYGLMLEVDRDTYPMPNCGNLFEISKGEFSAALDNGFGPQLNRLMRIFRQHWFKNDKFVTWDTYFNSGIMVFGKHHREVFKKTQEFYFKNKQEFAVANKADDLNDQTIINFVLADMGVKLNVLPRSYNVLDLHMERFLINSYTDELGRDIIREENILDCINIFHVTNGSIRNQASEYFKKEIWKL